jgi:arsenate reductase-like glutaredoxin family protein
LEEIVNDFDGKKIDVDVKLVWQKQLKKKNLKNWLKLTNTLKYMYNDSDTYMERDRWWKKKWLHWVICLEWLLRNYIYIFHIF